jgi:hypothetical protein
MATAYGARTPAQVFALAFGVLYLLIGIIGFAVTGFDNFASDNPAEWDDLIIFSLNPLHNVVHLAIGALWIGASRTLAAAKSVNVLIGAVFGLLFVLGLTGILEFVAIEDAAEPDNYLHLATAALALYFGTAGAEGTRVTGPVV